MCVIYANLLEFIQGTIFLIYLICILYCKKEMNCWNFFKIRYLEVEDLWHAFLIQHCLINVDNLEKRTGQITDVRYFASITVISISCQQAGNEAFHVVNKYNLGLLWWNRCFYAFDWYSKDQNSNLSTGGFNLDATTKIRNLIVSRKKNSAIERKKHENSEQKTEY